MVEIVEIRQIEFKKWAELYRSYAEFYNVTMTEDQLRKVWAWLDGYETELLGLAALVDGEARGIIHYRRFLRPLAAEIGIFLDDIYVCQTARRRGVGNALLRRLEDIAKAQGCKTIRWITANYNQEAQIFYDQFGKKSGWITYDHNMGDDDGCEKK
ncbi:MAG: GNAT family N-acetyltransferase [Emcibacter sp.]|nr:GNAT family N-acetyltransferase [Emcibacter sp.]